MAAVIHRENRTELLEAIRTGRASNWRVGLFVNNFTPVETDTFADFTEPSGPWYSRLTPSWSASALDGSGDAYTNATTVTFAHDGVSSLETAYGWFLLDVVAGEVIASDRFSGPKTFAASGDTQSVTLTVYLTEAP